MNAQEVRLVNRRQRLLDYVRSFIVEVNHTLTEKDDINIRRELKYAEENLDMLIESARECGVV